MDNGGFERRGRKNRGVNCGLSEQGTELCEPGTSWRAKKNPGGLLTFQFKKITGLQWKLILWKGIDLVENQYLRHALRANL